MKVKVLLCFTLYTQGAILMNLGQHNSLISPFLQWHGEAGACLCTGLTHQDWLRSALWHFCDSPGPAQDLCQLIQELGLCCHYKGNCDLS